jgi:MscS family membrane protein
MISALTGIFRLLEPISRLSGFFFHIQEGATSAVSGASSATGMVGDATEPESTVEEVWEGLSEVLPTLADISLTQWATAFGIILASFIIRKVILALLEKKGMQWAQKTKTRMDDMFIEATTSPLGYLIIFIGIYAAISVLGLPVTLFLAIGKLLQAIIIVIVGWYFIRLSDVAAEYISDMTKRTDSKLDDQLVPLIRKSLKVFVAVIAFVTVVQELGFNVSALVAGLGIGGLAVALAARDTLANLFGSFVILVDRPFQVGDWIVSGDVEGVVEEVGFRSTRIRTFAKTLITMPNSQLADSAINNWSRMPIRRVKMTVGVTYETDAGQMEGLLEKIKDILRNHEQVYQDFFLVNFTDFGGSSLEIFLYYFTTTTVWGEYLQVRQEVNLSIMRTLEEMGLEIAFPSTALYIRDGKGGTFDPTPLITGKDDSGEN